MAKVHFIWWGIPTQNARLLEAAIDGPWQAATAVGGDHQIVFWHQEGWNPPPVSLNPLNLQTLGTQVVDRLPFEAGLGAKLFAPRDTKATLRKIFDTLQKRQAFAAFKDLLSLCVLYLEGGFYFDTSIVVDRKTLSANLTTYENLNQLRVMARYVDKATKAVFLDPTPQSIAGGPVGSSIPGVPAIEVSAMYAPAQSHAVKTMIQGYVTRCVAVNIHTDRPVPKLGLKGPVLQPRGDSEMRKRVIGNIVIDSVYDGLIAQARTDGVKKREELGDKIKEYCWGAIDTTGLDPQPPEPLRTTEPQYMPQLGVRKRSLQTWK